MLRTAGWLALPRRTLSAGFDGGISPPFQFVAAQLLGGWVPTETRLSLASPSRLLWTHNSSALRQALGDQTCSPNLSPPVARTPALPGESRLLSNAVALGISQRRRREKL